MKWTCCFPSARLALLIPKRLLPLRLKCSASPQRMKHRNINRYIYEGCGCLRHRIQVSLSRVCAADDINLVKLNQGFKLLTWLCCTKSVSRPRFGINSENFPKQLNIFQFLISWPIFPTHECKSRRPKAAHLQHSFSCLNPPHPTRWSPRNTIKKYT